MIQTSNESYLIQKIKNIMSDDPLEEVSDFQLIKTLAIALTESHNEIVKLREDIQTLGAGLDF